MGPTLKELMNQAFARYPERTAVRLLRPAGASGDLAYQPITYQQLQAQRDGLAAGLVALGLAPGQRVGILTDGGSEPLLVFLAADLMGLCSVPLCPKLPPEILIHNINHSGIAALVLDTKGHQQLIRIRPFLARVPQLILTQGDAEGALGWEQLMAPGQGAPPEVEVRPEDESKILYTSGSSGLPKGVIQTHANIVANLEEVRDCISRKEVLRIFKSVPDYHSLGILNIYFPLVKGWVLDLARSPDRVLVDIRYSAPECFLTVPLVLDKVYGSVRREIAAGGLKGRLVARVVAAKQRLARGQAGLGDRLLHLSVGRRVVAQIRAQLARRVGNNLELLIVGSAKADPAALDFFQEVLEITSFEGYGTTECAPLIAANNLGGNRTGTVGRPFLEARLVGAGADVGYADPHLGVYRGSGGQAGELWVHGPNVMKGYLDDPDQTAMALVEDAQGKVWYRTGDLFSLDDEGFLTFRGRLGRQFKLKNGEFVNPELLERVFARVGLLEHVLVWGDQSCDAPLVLATVDVEEARKLRDLPGLPLDDEPALRQHPALAERVRQLLLAEADTAGLPTHERPQKVLLLPESLSEETGTLTRGLKKMVPGTVAQRYRELIVRAMAEG